MFIGLKVKMTVIHGDIYQIFEIEKDAYTQPFPGSGNIAPYSFAAVIAGTSTGYFSLTEANFGTHNLLHNIIISSSSVAAAMQRVYLIHYPNMTVLGDFYFRYDTISQFFLGDIEMDLTDGSSIRIYLENNSGANEWMGGVLWYVVP